MEVNIECSILYKDHTHTVPHIPKSVKLFAFSVFICIIYFASNRDKIMFALCVALYHDTLSKLYNIYSVHVFSVQLRYTI